MSIIFDRGAEKSTEVQGLDEAIPSKPTPPDADDESSITYANMDMDESSNGIMTASNLDMDEQTQYQMIYGDYTATGGVSASVYGDISNDVALPTSNSSTETGPIIPGDTTDISGSVSAADYTNSIGKSIPLPKEGTGMDIHQVDEAIDADSEALRSQELDDMAMLGIDVEDMAAQCFWILSK